MSETKYLLMMTLLKKVQFHPGKEQIGVENVRTACGTDLNTQVHPMMFWSVWRRVILMRWSHSIRSTIAVLVSGKTLNMRCFLVRSCMITDSKIPMQDVRSRLKVTASLSAVFRSQKRTKLLHISGTCPGDGSHYYGCIRFLTCALLDYHIKLRDLQL